MINVGVDVGESESFGAMVKLAMIRNDRFSCDSFKFSGKRKQKKLQV